MAYLGNSEGPVWSGGFVKMNCGGRAWKNTLRSNYGRDNGWKGIEGYKEKVKENEHKWVGPVEGFPRAEIMTE